MAAQVNQVNIPTIELNGVCECPSVISQGNAYVSCAAIGGMKDERCSAEEVKANCRQYLERTSTDDLYNLITYPSDDPCTTLLWGQTVKQLEPEHTGNKYHRTIHDIHGKESITVDVYCVIDSFHVINPGLQHAIKKLLCAGIRGKGDVLQDLKEARDAISRAITIEQHVAR